MGIQRPRKMLPANTKYGRWTTTGRHQIRRYGERGGNRIYECKCDCGTVSWVDRSGLVYGTSTSCGCYAIEARRISKRKHSTPPPINELITRYKYAAKKRGLVWELTHDEAFSLFTSHCTYCGEPPRRPQRSRFGDVVIVGGIDRRNSAMGYTTANCVACCADCNYAKNDMTESQWDAWIDRIVQFRSCLQTLSKSRHASEPSN